ncbi:MAG: single-stranded-DNA-specific exonuclease RecJ [Candidatus Neomarinimicrobiota bacterium]|tara:strand:- start:16603 stop:18321 length:1719 start_codon:yes stop_codon:yes gene_type:complete
MSNFIWKYKNFDDDDILKISNEFSLPKSISTVMSIKKINTKELSRSFFYHDLNNLHNPLLMKDMDKAINRFIEAKESKQVILIIGDYDTDGVSAASVLHLYFKSLGVDSYYYIPHRQKEGYGVSKNAIDYGIKIGAQLIISCDCGITAIEQVNYANENNLDFIVTDHHKQKETLPDAYAILNPNQNDCNYPFKGLCGAGVAFKLCLAINDRLKLNPDNVYKYLDLVAIATTADVMPVLDENRIIIAEGMKRVLIGSNKGIKSLINVSNLNNPGLTVGKLSYWFIPKINAAGRLGDAARAVKLFTTNNPQLANEISLDLENENNKRKAITLQHENEAINIINNHIDIDNQKIIVLYNDNWHFGIIGIVASRIKELYNRPTIVMTEENGMYKGSCRSIPGYDIVEALNSCSDIIDNYGGHPMAAGLSIKKDYLKDFGKKISAHALDNIEDNLTPVISIDCELKISDINDRFINFLNYLEPFGPKNPKPIFVSKDINGIKDAQLLGKERETLKFKIKDVNSDLDVIGFRMLENYEKVLSGKNVDIAYTIDKNFWNGRYSTQLVLKDIIFSDERKN